MSMEELWKPVVGYEGYTVSNQGRVRGPKGKILKGTPGANGYPRVSLVINGKVTYKNIHNLVAEAFIGARPAGYETRHLDGVKTNCVATNLAYGTVKENQADRVRHGTAVRGELVSSAVLNEQQVLEITARLDSGNSHKLIAADYGIAVSHVSAINIGAAWAWLTGRDAPEFNRHKQHSAAWEVAVRTGIKLTAEKVVCIVSRVQAGETKVSVARDFQVDPSMVGNIMSGKSWSHITGFGGTDDDSNGTDYSGTRYTDGRNS